MPPKRNNPRNDKLLKQLTSNLLTRQGGIEDKDDTNAGHVTAVTEDRSDQLMDEDEINRELVMWAGRLELESIDLRDKSKGLTSQLLINSQSLRNTSDMISREFKNWKVSTTKQLNGIVDRLGQSTSSLESRSLSTSNMDIEISEVLQMLRSVSKIVDEMNHKTFTNETISTQNKKLQTILNSVNSLQSNNSAFQHSQQDTQKNFKTMERVLDKCLRRLEDTQNLQVDLFKELQALRKSQTTMSVEISKINSKISQNNSIDLDADHYLGTPNSSLPMDNNLPQLQHPPQIQKKGRRGRPHGYKLNSRKLIPTRNPIQTRRRALMDDSNQYQYIEPKQRTKTLFSNINDTQSQMISLLSDDLEF